MEDGPLTWTALSEQRTRHRDPFSNNTQLFPHSHFYPLYLSRLVTLEISNNAQDYTDSGITYLYQADAHVTAVQPSSALDVGGTPVFVQGENFVNSTWLRCRIGPYVMTGMYVGR